MMQFRGDIGRVLVVEPVAAMLFQASDRQSGQCD
jgi:hypothetical protein